MILQLIATHTERERNIDAHTLQITVKYKLFVLHYHYDIILLLLPPIETYHVKKVFIFTLLCFLTRICILFFHQLLHSYY